MELDKRILAAAMQPPQPQWNPVLGFLLPLYSRLVAAGGVCTPDAEVAAAWDTALAAFRVLGFEYVPILGCRKIDNQSANERALDAALDDAAKEAR